MNKPSDSKRAGEAPYRTLHRAVLTRRIALIAAGGVACLGATHRATAQAAKRRVAYLAFSSPNNPFLAQLRSGLRELGWIEGNNLTLDVRYAHGDATQFVPLTVQLLALEPDVCVVSADFMAEAVGWRPRKQCRSCSSITPTVVKEGIASFRSARRFG